MCVAGEQSYLTSDARSDPSVVPPPNGSSGRRYFAAGSALGFCRSPPTNGRGATLCSGSGYQEPPRSGGHQLVLSKPDFGAMALGCLPSPQILHNRDMIYVAIGILGATVMPHNLYLHSSIAQTRHYLLTVQGKREAIFFGTIDST